MRESREQLLKDEQAPLVWEYDNSPKVDLYQTFLSIIMHTYSPFSR